MNLLVTRRDGSTELLDIKLPVTFDSPEQINNPVLTMWQMHDAQGTDYFFNKSDGTYDGWGRGVCCNEEAEQLLTHARTSKTPPKITEQ